MYYQVVTIFSFFLLATTARADCMFFDLKSEAQRIPIIVKARVLNTNNTSGELHSCANRGDTKCIYRFQIQVLQTLKGKVLTDVLEFSYPYWIVCPGVDTYQENETRIFFVNAVKSSGKAELYGNSCGFGSIPIADSDSMKFLMKQIQ
jgi:hypothetical protein